MNEYPKVIDTGGIRVTAHNAKEEARWTAQVTTSVPVHRADIATKTAPDLVAEVSAVNAPVVHKQPQTFGKQKQAAKQAAHTKDTKKK